MLIEVCVDSLAGVAEAVAGGADRLELCAALAVGGLTPSAGMMRAAAGCGVPVYAMIRPRAGDFVFFAGEVAVMLADIDAARAAGLAGVVLGASMPDGRLDVGVLAQLVAAAQGMGLTLHRAFDLVPDMAEAVEVAVGLGFERILTSGQAVTAVAGIEGLARVFDLAAGRIGVMPGAGVSAATVGKLRARLPLREVHGSCSVVVGCTGQVAALGFAGPGLRETRAAEVRALRAALTH
ncbi:MAG: copper homeostasis protein CutC [Paracoccaceae bacterium]